MASVADRQQNLNHRRAEHGYIDGLKCSQGHDLELYRFKTLKYRGRTQCDTCKTVPLDNSDKHYHCETCSFDLCRSCALIKVGQLKKFTQMISHDH